MDPPGTRKILRFSVFEADVESGELFKKGQKVKLQEQPFHLLVELLKHPGEVLTREQLKERLWPEETAGEFDSGLNRAVNRIREVLGDSAETPMFIETLPRRGYRFIGTVSGVRSEGDQAPRSKSNRLGIVLLLSVVLLLLCWLTWHLTRRGSSPPEDLALRQLTTNSPENPISTAVISPDGRYLAYADLAGIRLEELSNGQIHAVAKPEALSDDDAWFPSSWFPDSHRMLASSIRTDQNGRVYESTWSVPVLGNPIQLRDNSFSPSVSPDGSLIAFTSVRELEGQPLSPFNNPWAREIWVMGPNGEEPRKVVTSDGKTLFNSLQWSPSGGLLAYLALHANWKPQGFNIETIGLQGGAPNVIVENFKGSEFRWILPGRIFYSQSEASPDTRESNLWAIKVDPRTGKPRAGPSRMTKLPGFGITGLSASMDGRKLAFQNVSYSSDTYIARIKAGGELDTPRRLTWNERNNTPFAWTMDGKSVIFVSDRTGVNSIYRQAISQDLAELIPTGAQQVWVPRVTPDGSALVYLAIPDSHFPMQSAGRDLMRVPISGGPREALMHFPDGFWCNLDCPIHAGAWCIVEVQSGGDEQSRNSIFYAFDPLTGRRRELFRRSGGVTPYDQWTESPDGARIATLHGNTIQVLSLEGKVEQTIQVSGWPYAAAVDWQADGEGFLVPHTGPRKVTLLRVSMKGEVKPLWSSESLVFMWAIASPDGQHLAIWGSSTSRNVWVMEKF